MQTQIHSRKDMLKSSLLQLLYSSGFCDTCQPGITSLLQGTCRQQLYSYQSSPNITCSFQLKMLQGELSLHTPQCPSPLSEGLQLSLPYIFTDPRRQDWVQLGPSHFAFQRTCLTWYGTELWGRIYWICASVPSGRQKEGLGGADSSTKLRKTQGHSEKHKDMVKTKPGLLLAGKVSQNHSWHVGLSLHSSAYHITEPVSWCPKYN